MTVSGSPDDEGRFPSAQWARYPPAMNERLADSIAEWWTNRGLRFDGPLPQGDMTRPPTVNAAAPSRAPLAEAELQTFHNAGFTQ